MTESGSNHDIMVSKASDDNVEIPELKELQLTDFGAFLGLYEGDQEILEKLKIFTFQDVHDIDYQLRANGRLNKNDLE